jgi:hypothetical protein
VHKELLKFRIQFVSLNLKIMLQFLNDLLLLLNIFFSNSVLSR